VNVVALWVACSPRIGGSVLGAVGRPDRLKILVGGRAATVYNTRRSTGAAHERNPCFHCIRAKGQRQDGAGPRGVARAI